MHEADRAAMGDHLDQDIAQSRAGRGGGGQTFDPEWRHGQPLANATTYSQGAPVSLAKVVSAGAPKPRQSPAPSSWRSPPSVMTRPPRLTHTIWRMWA